MTPIRIPTYSERQNRALKRIVEFMAADESRAESRYGSLRRHDRLKFQGQVQVCLPTPAVPTPAEDHPTAFSAWAYNLSPGGIGFVTPETITCTTLAVGLRRQDGSTQWMTGRVVRSRSIPQEEFFDYGVVFEKTAPAEKSSAVSPEPEKVDDSSSMPALST